MEGSAKKVAEGSDASRKYVARVGLNWRLHLLSGSEASELEAALVFLKMRQTRYTEYSGNASAVTAVVAVATAW